ncbi:MAG: hypothetical protein IKA06_01715 [Clostridia bacterium]|nr:hypothetical protein [Clostridia bacterium]
MSETVREPRAEGILSDATQIGAAQGAGDPSEASGLSEEEFSSFMESINTMAPLLKGLGGVFGGKRSEACAVREAFLLSLKPYLSPSRCEAVDYLVRIARIGDILRTLA